MMHDLNPVKRTVFYVWYHRQVIFWALLAILAVHLLNREFASQAAVIGPEYLTRAAVALFRFALAGFLTFHADKWLAPTIKDFCDRSEHDQESAFERAWKVNPQDPRIPICVDFYKWLFVGFVLALSL